MMRLGAESSFLTALSVLEWDDALVVMDGGLASDMSLHHGTWSLPLATT